MDTEYRIQKYSFFGELSLQINGEKYILYITIYIIYILYI